MAAADQNGIVDLLWGQLGKQPAPARPSLSLPAIVAAATAIADAEGIDGVSMQRVAGDLGFTKMSLYRYVSSKADLVAVMVESAVGAPPDLSRVEGGWRERLLEFSRLLAAVWQRHPWLPWATLGERVMGPREVGWVEAAVGALDGTGLSGGERMDAVFLLFGHLRNTESLTTSGTQPWTSDRRPSDAFARILDRHGATFPALAAAIGDLGDAPHDNGRAFGLACILDGLTARIDAKP
ncbi:regulatory protein, tetR family [Nonomuraea solani]|uniref:Regulatory protein, tetR family n=1 Tax=Nonomuraea solani TaxID=1144553 RepID=A0A1H6E1T2_9ACTN|nr:TetR/AcrR family transcriptional regulator C-terminal domain-containing protein [Nonomuraea solani]SEG91608.1 regulatory protein, tetR family [Nonomuraea solani]